MNSLRIAVADDELDMRDYLKTVLPLVGHQVVGAAATGSELIELCRSARPDLVLTDIRLPDMDGITASSRICQERPIPTVLISAYHEEETIARANADHVMGYLVKPIKQADLGPAISVAYHRFEQFRSVAREAGHLRQALEDRKQIERAKGVVMRRLAMGEQEAFRRMQKEASNKNRRLVDVAQTVLSAEEIFRTLEQC